METSDLSPFCSKRDCGELRRKTRSQFLQEKRLKAEDTTSLQFSEVSIQTLHSICAPVEASHKQSLNSHNLPSIGSSQSTFQQKEMGRSPLSASEACSSKDIRLIKAPEEAHAPPQDSNDAVEELWLEVSVEIDYGINLVVDLDLDRSTTGWLDLGRNYCLVLSPDKVVDGMQRCWGSNESAAVASVASGSSAEALRTDRTTAQDDDQLTTTLGIFTQEYGDAGSKTAQLGILAACVQVESQAESSTLGMEVRREGFSFASLERMPTYLATGFKGPAKKESSNANGNTDRMVVCIEV
ncbi:hypothetical protein GOP47_0015940 [Adiantum capillus-veneris]|uniref:Uncharacterized protein n=1 Tax=Adiantum capillus-veneris TaxID=13818 RepID=A0A9D4ZC31_ADICA|nr:hypothetical protein GOP47_0015940 [Adiantum capillus-veneris]